MCTIMKYFTSKKLNEHLTLITTITAENLFLVEGSNKAILIDTSEGAGDLKGFVEKLTSKPIEVILTHGHIDHAMGAVAFEKVYMNPADKAVYEAMSDIPQRQEYIEMSVPKEKQAAVKQLALLNADGGAEKFLPLKDGQRFDLDGTTLEVYSLAGHTPGMMVVLLVEDRILIAGDAANTATFLFDDYCASVSDYQNNLQKLAKRLAGRYDKVYLSHHELEAPKDLLQRVSSVCQDVLDGKADNQRFDFMGKTAWIAKEVGPGFIRKDGGFGNIIYNKDNI